MKLRVAVWLCLLISSVSVFARKEETLDELVARANQARPEQQIDLYMEIAERELKFAVSANTESHNDALHSALQQIVKYSGNAHSAALHADKHLKHTEIKLRGISARLRDLKLNADVEAQPAVQAAIDQIEGFRTELLKALFGSKSND